MEQQYKRGRGRPKKILPNEELQLMIDSINQLKMIKELINPEEENPQTEEKLPKVVKREGEWDIGIDDDIDFFDANLSYELTGYRPINNEKGLDFNPDWFTETRDTYLKTGHYCTFRFKSRHYNQFWDELYIRCRNGMTVNGYTITGDHYFFLNFYQLDDLTSATKAGGGRKRIFPNFFTEQYKWFHYLEIAKRLRKNAALMKARGVGKF